MATCSEKRFIDMKQWKNVPEVKLRSFNVTTIIYDESDIRTYYHVSHLNCDIKTGKWLYGVDHSDLLRCHFSTNTKKPLIFFSDNLEAFNKSR